MSSEIQLPLSMPVAAVEPVRPCAFYMTEMQAHTPRQKTIALTPVRSHLQQRCLLNPGRASGPDGNEISVEQCNLERQAACQAQRRAALARLNATCSSRAAA